MPLSARSRLAAIPWILVSFLPALTGLVAMPDAWYAALAKPAWNPPNWIFGPVWTLLYASMGVAAWFAWRHGAGTARRRAFAAFFAQLALNAAWTPSFFLLHDLTVALAVILLLWCAILATVVLFGRIHRAAALTLLPYLAWVTFATALTAALRFLNM